MYVVHFFVAQHVLVWSLHKAGLEPRGDMMFLASFLAVAAATYMMARWSLRFIEQPFIDLGSWIVKFLRPRAIAGAS